MVGSVQTQKAVTSVHVCQVMKQLQTDLGALVSAMLSLTKLGYLENNYYYHYVIGVCFYKVRYILSY